MFPIYITVVNSLLTPVADHRQPPKFFPTDPQWSATATRGTPGTWRQYLKNSFIVTLIITVGQVVTAILAGYAFAFLEFPFKRTLFVVFLATLMVPFEVTIVTNVTTISDLGWYNTLRGPGGAVPRHRLRRVPDAPGVPHPARAISATPPPSTATGTGASSTRVAVPLARPAVAALPVFAFLAAWNQYLWPLLITKDDAVRTVQIGLKQLQRPEHRPGQHHVRGGDHRGAPARHPAAGVPEAARARADRGRGQGLRQDMRTPMKGKPC